MYVGNYLFVAVLKLAKLENVNIQLPLLVSTSALHGAMAEMISIGIARVILRHMLEVNPFIFLIKLNSWP